ncbi:hypothetical protein C0033_17905 [Clostridium sp. chh4-2]|nr:hypothetical protein C0033_17905 [Clostridium sp. chh4-2]
MVYLILKYQKKCKHGLYRYSVNLCIIKARLTGYVRFLAFFVGRNVFCHKGKNPRACTQKRSGENGNDEKRIW